MHQCIILQVVRSRAVPSQVSLQEARNLSPTIVYGLLHSQQHGRIQYLWLFLLVRITAWNT